MTHKRREAYFREGVGAYNEMYFFMFTDKWAYNLGWGYKLGQEGACKRHFTRLYSHLLLAILNFQLIYYLELKLVPFGYCCIVI